MNTFLRTGSSICFGVFWKEVHYKTTSAPFFPFGVDFFLEEAQCTGKQRKSHKSCSPCTKWRKALPRVSSYLNSFGAKFQTTFVVYFLILTNCHLERRLYVKLTVKQRRSRWDGSLSSLIWIYAVCESLLWSPVALKELNPNFAFNTLFVRYCTSNMLTTFFQCSRNS